MKPTLTLSLIMAGTILCSEGQPAQHDPHRDAMAGQKLDAKAAAQLEGEVVQHPDDLSTRTKLLGYYFKDRHGSNEAKAKQRLHVLWIIKNHPEAQIAGLPYCGIDSVSDREGYEEAKKLWLVQTMAHPQDATVLGNAATFFLIQDRKLAEDLLKQAEKIDPSNPQWSDRLGQLYSMQPTEVAAAKSLAEYEKAQAVDRVEMSRFYRLNALAKSAFKAGEIEKASRYANESLKLADRFPQDWNYGNAVHHGNNVLGLIALKQGDVKLADEYLLKAGKTTGSPQLNSFGPNMTLARVLLEKGERETVLQYFELCRKFWEMGGQRLDAWKKEVEAGQTPAFGGNLAY